MAADETLELRVDLGLDPEADALELEDSTLDLREELLELDVESVERPTSGPPPAGAKSPDVALGAALIVAAGKEVITAVVSKVASWVGRGRERSVKLQLDGDTIEITDPSVEEQRRLLEAFLARHIAES